VPESAAVVAIGEHDRKADQLLKRRRLEVQAVTNQEAPVRRKVRLYITHRHAHQPGSGGAADGGAGAEPPQWSLHLCGRVDPDVPEGHVQAVALSALKSGAKQHEIEAAVKEAAQRGAGVHPFTSLWRRVTVRIQYAKQQQQQQRQDGQDDDEEVIIWEKARHKGPHKEELQVMRIGSTPARVTIKLEADNTPPRYRWARR